MTLQEKLSQFRDRGAEKWASIGVSPKFASETNEGARIYQAHKQGHDSLAALVVPLIEALETLTVGHGVPLAAAMAAPPERYRIMAKELNELLQERTVMAREALEQFRQALEAK